LHLRRVLSQILNVVTFFFSPLGGHEWEKTGGNVFRRVYKRLPTSLRLIILSEISSIREDDVQFFFLFYSATYLSLSAIVKTQSAFFPSDIAFYFFVDRIDAWLFMNSS
jgi:hypothetical protein